MATAVTLASASHCASSRSCCVMVPKMRFCWLTVPSSLSLIRHAAMVCLCTSRPQQLRCTRMAILLCHWRRRLHWKNLPCELSGWRYHFAVPTASSSTWFAGSTNHTIAIIRARSHSGESHCALARQTFSCFVVTEISVMLTWYMLFFQFEGIAEAWLERDN